MPTDATPSTSAESASPERGRRIVLPVLLFLATCVSTFWTGSVDWKPLVHVEALAHGLKSFWENLPQGSPLTALQQGFAVAAYGLATRADFHGSRVGHSADP